MQILGKFGVLLDVFDLVAGDAHDVKRAVLEGGQRVIGRRDDLILEGVKRNLRGVPIGVVLFELNVRGAWDIACQHERAVGQETVRAGAVTARRHRVIEIFVDRIKSREAHQRKEERDGRVKFDNESLIVWRGYSQSRGVGTFDNGVGIFHAGNRCAHDVGIFFSLLAVTPPREHEIVGSDGLTVRPFGVAQVESISLAAVLGHVETFSQRGNNFAVRIELH